jgi:hypothetical protein
MKIHLILTAVLILLVSGCGKKENPESVTEKKQVPVTEKKQVPDNSSVMINYTVSGAGSGKILLAKKGAFARFDMTKISPDGNDVESMFYADNYLHFYIMGPGGLQPVKLLVIKDIEYRKSFASFFDASEYTKNLTPDGKEIICGKECDKFVYKADGSTFSVYNNRYVLKASFEGTVITATTFKEDAQIEDKFVRLPPGIIFTDITNEQK